MKLLLDTHSFLWFVEGDQRLSATARTAIEQSGNQSFLSIVSIWEMAIKISIGKLSLLHPLDQFIPAQIARNGFHLLPIELVHIAAGMKLPFNHRDPFDRLLIAQATVESMLIVGNDREFDKYSIHRIW